MKVGLAAMFLSALIAVAFPRGATAADDGLDHSDVVAMYAASQQTYRDFSVTVVEWGGHPQSEEDVESFVSWAVAPAHEMGIRYVGGAGMVTEFALFMQQYPQWEQAVCLNVHGERFTVPWLWDHSYEGEPAWWFCSNDPLFQQFLEDQVLLAVQAGVDGIHIDDHLGSANTYWLDGCFCEDCLAGFRDYLRDNVAPEDLAALGIADLDTFDYRDYVLTWLAANPGSSTFSAPLGGDYQTYQFRAAAGVMAGLRAAAEAAAGHGLTFSANGGPPHPPQMIDYDVLTHFCAEVQHQAWIDTNPPYVYKLSSALDRAMAATAGGWDWAIVKAEDRTGLVRAWIAQAYAFGHYFMTPHHQWCYTDELGTHWYDGPPEEYGPFYAFIRGHRALFDDFDGVAQVGVLHSSAAAREGEHPDREAAAALFGANVPFEMVVAGDDWVPARLTEDTVSGFEKVIAAPGLTLGHGQQGLLEALSTEGRLLDWEGAQTLEALPASWLTVTGAEHVWALLRSRRGGAEVVCHLLTRGYDAEADGTPEAGELSVSVRAEVFGDTLPARAVLYAPAASPIVLDLSQQADAVTFTVPSVSEWAVVHLAEEGFTDALADCWAYRAIMACQGAGIVTGFLDGSYQPDWPVTRAQMAVFVARSVVTPTGEAGIDLYEAPATPTFPDVATTHWAYRHVECLSENGIVFGYPDGFYRPTASVTRDQMAAYIARAIAEPMGEEGLAGYEPPTDPSFTDVSVDHWAYPYVEYAAEEEVVQGYPDGFYRPQRTVTRDQMAVYVARAFGLVI